MFVRVLLIALLASGTAGCEKTDHGNIDKWTRTEKGPGKLRKAVIDDSLDADLSAHAAANLIKMGQDLDVYAALDTLAPQRRNELIAKLAPRLWDIARVENEMNLPGPPQVAAKDALVRLRKYVDDTGKQQIDNY